MQSTVCQSQLTKSKQSKKSATRLSNDDTLEQVLAVCLPLMCHHFHIILGVVANCVPLQQDSSLLEIGDTFSSSHLSAANLYYSLYFYHTLLRTLELPMYLHHTSVCIQINLLSASSFHLLKLSEMQFCGRPKFG